MILSAIPVKSTAVRVAVAFYLGDIVDGPALPTDQRSYYRLGITSEH
jgi:hypothetical protein